MGLHIHNVHACLWCVFIVFSTVQLCAAENAQAKDFNVTDAGSLSETIGLVRNNTKSDTPSLSEEFGLPINEMVQNVSTNNTGVPHILSLSERLGLRTNFKVRPHNRTVTKCHIRPIDKGTHQEIRDFLESRTRLMEFMLDFQGYDVNPLEVNVRTIYRGHSWSRLSAGHGRTLLSLTFNYGTLSLKTLSFGVQNLTIKVQDNPKGCVGRLPEQEKIYTVMDLAVRDFKEGGNLSLSEGESVCHQIVINDGTGRAQFADRCCEKIRRNATLHCEIDIPSRFLRMDFILSIVLLIVMLFGPLIIIPRWMYAVTLDTVPYKVELKEPLMKTVCVVDGKNAISFQSAPLKLDLNNIKGFENCKEVAKSLPRGKILKVKIHEYKILVNYRKLLKEDMVPVGLFETLTRAIFQCKMQHTSPFTDCCQADICGRTEEKTAESEDYDDLPLKKRSSLRWIKVCKLFGKLLLVFCVPIPFYIRVLIYYLYEHEEMEKRHRTTAMLGLSSPYNQRLLQYFTPIHPVFFLSYVIYFIVGISIAIITSTTSEKKFHRILINSARDLFLSSWVKAIGMLIKNFLWPFKKFGIWGLFIGIVYWPVAMTGSLIVCVFYCPPTIYIIVRLIINSLHCDGSKTYDRDNILLGDINAFEVQKLFSKKEKLIKNPAKKKKVPTATLR